MENTLRINKYISETGFCSRREADKLIENKRVKINGVIASIGSKVTDSDEVLIDNKPIKPSNEYIYIVLNKPRGITCTTEEHVPGNIIHFVNHPKRIFPIGRLDKDSEGLILLTNDGDIVNKILRAGNNHEKEYIVTVNKPLTNDFLNSMSKGVKILDTITKPCAVKKINNYTFNIVLTQGLNRQIRRMCTTLGFNVTNLKRIRIMNITLSNLPLGKWRYVTKEELKTINKLTENSTKTKEGSM